MRRTGNMSGGGHSGFRHSTPSSSSRPTSSAAGRHQGSDPLWGQIPPFPVARGEPPEEEPWIYEVQVGNGGAEIFHPPEVPPEEIYPGKGVPYMFLKGKGKGEAGGPLEDKGKGKMKGKGNGELGGERSASTTSEDGDGDQDPHRSRSRQPGDGDPDDGGNAPRDPVYITRFGEKFHLRINCPSLYNTRGFQRSLWCPVCSTQDQRPMRVYAQGPGSVAHEDPYCPSAQVRRRLYERCGLCGR